MSRGMADAGSYFVTSLCSTLRSFWMPNDSTNFQIDSSFTLILSRNSLSNSSCVNLISLLLELSCSAIFLA